MVKLKKYSHIITKGVLYGGFLFVIYLLLTSNNSLPMKIILTIIMIGVLITNILYDYLKKLNDQLQIALVVDCDIPQAETLMRKIEHYDLLKGMKPTLVLTQTLIYLDTYNPTQCINHIHEHEQFFSGHPDYLLIKYHSLFKSYYYLNDLEHATEAYHHLQRFKQTTKKKNSVSQLYNYNEIDANYLYLTQAYKKSLDAYKATDIKRFNNRELIHYYVGLVRVETDMKRHSNIRKYIKSIEDLNPSSPLLGALKNHD